MQICMTGEDELLYSVFHDAVLRKERSIRAFNLTDKIIGINSGDYTAWWLRRRCIEAKLTSTTDEEELCYVLDWIRESPKNYQAWYHRRWLLLQTDITKDPDVVISELVSCNDNLEEDAKNHCAWQYRQFLMETFKMDFKPEFEYIDQLLTLDPRNNSAWNYRFWLFEHGDKLSLLPNEVEFSLHWIKLTPHNESPYNYLLGLLRNGDTQILKDEIFEQLSKIAEQQTTETDMYAAELMAFLKPENQVDLSTNKSIRKSYYEYLKQAT